jgi:NAD(P)-dependent dehydrogenase (short-subunit alcohol dehydrogenase family)
MGQVVRRTPAATPLRIVNVSTAAAVRGFAGLGAYGSGKAGLRMAGMVLAAEIEEARARGEQRDIAILSYEPGAVDTPMQVSARSSARETLPSVDMFVGLAADGRLVAPAEPAREIVAFLESEKGTGFTERRYAGKA